MSPSFDPYALPQLHGDEGRVLFHCQAPLAIEVRQWQQWRWLLLDPPSADLQGLMRLDQPQVPQLPYLHAMLGGLALQPNPRSVLDLGLGTAALSRFLRHYFPTVSLTTVEQSPLIVQLARRFFELDPQVPVILEDALAFLQRNRSHFDLLFCDLHDGRRHPFFTDARYPAELARALSPAGVLAINLLHPDRDDLLPLLIALRDHLPHGALLETGQNLVLFAARQPLSNHWQLAAQQLEELTGLTLSSWLWRMQPLPLRT